MSYQKPHSKNADSTYTVDVTKLNFSNHEHGGAQCHAKNKGSCQIYFIHH